MAKFKNVFVLCTGRCGSKSIINALQYANNYTAGHESKATALGAERLNFGENHIEADNRLSWFLGRLDQTYGADAMYIHLKREEDSLVKSINARWGPFTILRAYTYGILKTQGRGIEYAKDYCKTINENILCFLKDKPHQIEMKTENLALDFEKLWTTLEIEGNFSKAMQEINKKHNTTQHSYSGWAGFKLKLYHIKIAFNEFFY